MINNKKAALDFKTFSFGFILFSVFATVLFGLFSGMAEFYQVDDLQTSEVLIETNRSRTQIVGAYDDLTSNLDPEGDTDIQQIKNAAKSAKGILNTVTYPIDVLVALNTDINNMAGDRYPWLTIQPIWITAIIGFITISLILILIYFIFGRSLTQ